MDAFTGMISMVGFTWAPKGWAVCDGTLMEINQHQALFALIGTEYGGDGRSTFALPNLKGHVPGGVGSFIICVNGNFPMRP